MAKKPKLNVTTKDLGVDDKGLREIELTATATSDSGIEFYSFDFNFNTQEKKFDATIMLNRNGKQVYKFKPGTHDIAVKAVDNEGLEAMEVVKLKINGNIGQI